MSTFKQKLSLAISISAFALSASAAVPGVYLGLGAGYSNLSNFSDTTKTKQNNFGGKLFIGYNFNKYLGLEASYARYGKTTYEDNFYDFTTVLNYHLKTFSAAVKGYVPFDENNEKNHFDIYGLLGIAHTQADVQATFYSPFFSPDKENLSNTIITGMMGLGVSYIINPHITTSIEYTFTAGKSGDSEIGIPHADLITLNISYNI